MRSGLRPLESRINSMTYEIHRDFEVIMVSRRRILAALFCSVLRSIRFFVLPCVTNAVFVKPDAEIRGYRNVLLDPLQTSFARNWDPNRGGRSLLTRLDAGDMSAIEDRKSVV